jgi:hypothetical protein
VGPCRPTCLSPSTPPTAPCALAAPQDNLFRIFGGDRIKGLMSAFRIEDLPIESQMLTSALDEAQRKASTSVCRCLLLLVLGRMAGLVLGRGGLLGGGGRGWQGGAGAGRQLPPPQPAAPADLLCLSPNRTACPSPGSLARAVPQVESYFYDIRKQLFEYDQVLNTQRDKVYAERRRALEAADLTPLMVEYAEKTIDDILEVRGASGRRRARQLVVWPHQTECLCKRVEWAVEWPFQGGLPSGS